MTRLAEEGNQRKKDSEIRLGAVTWVGILVAGILQVRMDGS